MESKLIKVDRENALKIVDLIDKMSFTPIAIIVRRPPNGDIEIELVGYEQDYDYVRDISEVVSLQAEVDSLKQEKSKLKGEINKLGKTRNDIQKAIKVLMKANNPELLKE